MPYEAVADDFHVVLHTEFYELVGELEVPYAFCWMDLFVLHAVLCNDRVEVLCQGLDSDGVKTADLPFVDSCTDGEVVLECVLQGRLLL